MNVRLLRTALRTAHLVAFGALYGGHVYRVPGESLHPALLATVATGVALAGLDSFRSPIWFVQIRGLATLLKVLLMLLVAVFWEHRVALLTAVVVIGGVSSHMPGKYRYWSVLHGRVAGEHEAG